VVLARVDPVALRLQFKDDLDWSVLYFDLYEIRPLEFVKPACVETERAMLKYTRSPFTKRAMLKHTRNPFMIELVPGVSQQGEKTNDNSKVHYQH